MRMSAETGIAPTEQQRPEYLHFSPDHISGLQARLALGGDALDPTKSFDRQITPDMVTELADRDLTKVVAAVTMQGASKKSAPTHTDWAVSYGKVLDSKHNKANVAKLAQIIGKSGIAIAGDNGTRVAEAIHKRYFQTGKSIEMKKGTKTKAYQAVDLTQVVEDVLAGYTLENKINYDKLKEDRKEIMWFLKIFPKGSDEIIWALVDEEAKRRSNPNGFYADINAEVQVTQGSTRKTVRRFEPDALTAYEKKMLKLIWNTSEVPVISIQPEITTDFDSFVTSIEPRIQALKQPWLQKLMRECIADLRERSQKDKIDLSNVLTQQTIDRIQTFYERGDRDLAYKIAELLTDKIPTSSDAWLVRAGLTDDMNAREQYLNKVLEIDPDNDIAKRELKKIETKKKPASTAAPENNTSTGLESQKLLINERKQKEIIAMLPDIFDELPLRYKSKLMYSDFLYVMVGLKPATQLGMAGDVYNERDVKKMKEVLHSIGLEVELTNVTHTGENNIPFHHVHIYNPSVLQAYTAANSDICTPYQQGMTFKEWQQTLDSRGYMYGFSQGYPRTAIEDCRDNPDNSDPRRKTERLGNETYWHIRDGADISFRHKELEKFIKLLQESKEHQAITQSGDFMLAEKVWRRNLPEPIRKPDQDNLEDLFEKDVVYTVVSMMESIPEIPARRNPYRIEHVPNVIDLDSTERQMLLSVEPFFLVNPGSEGKLRIDINPEVASFVHTLQVDLKDKRYIAAEAVTHNDSGVFALCAASARNPAEQTKLFHHVATEIVRTHRMSSNLMQLWLHNQFVLQESGSSSLNVFYTFDQNRPAEEKLLEFNEGDTPQRVITNTVKKWEVLSDELAMKLNAEEPLSTLDLRRIEFLAHSIKVDKLLELIKSRSSN